ncbi:19777_t:CDS:10 [Dentiscutata erythropus]|uniref:ubiquitinyl hydrolase 1 n=1 Tax=Dentiscutata erythropus TaxID=1348616 RepID=A0A9N9A8F9_9GLOM|nr:19777_t:CDS:10 [Dentiscutata erythropus]
MSLLRWIVGTPGKTPPTDAWSASSEKYFGLENPFRECVINFPNVSVGSNMQSISSQTQQPSIANSTSSKKDQVNGENKVNGDSNLVSTQAIENTLFGALKDLFCKISSQKKRTGSLAPNNFVTKLKKENELFRSTMHQDAHEFLNYVLNAIAENVLEQQKKMAEAERVQREQSPFCNIIDKSKLTINGTSTHGSDDADEKSSKSSESNSGTSPHTTWVHQLFEGTLTNETKCLTCETVTSRDESFLDLSIDIEQNSSVTSCLRQFSASEMLCHKNKFFCDVCCGYQEAEKRMKIKKLPNVLALHLKRFKYQEKLQRYIKLSYRVVFPFELRLFNTCDDMEDPDRLYELYAVCVHIGSGPYHGHYVTLVKSMGQWLLFDDDNVETVDEAEIQKYFGDSPGTGSGYVLFYQACDLDQNINGLSNTIWTNSNVTGSSASSTELDTLETNDSSVTDISIPANGGTINNDTTSVTNNAETRRHPIREPSFSDRLSLWKNTEKRKSNTEQDNISKINEEGSINTHEKTPSGEKPEKTALFWRKEKKEDKKDDKDDKKSNSTGSTVEENGKEHNTTSKKDKKAEKEERKREKKLEKSKKLEKDKLPTSPNGIQATM